MARSRVLLIDGQLFQSQAFHRGIGKYSLALLEELDKVTSFYQEKILLLNEQEISKSDLLTIEKCIPNAKIVRLNYQLMLPRRNNDYQAITAHNKLLLDDYIAHHYPKNEVDFIILSLFHEGECPAFPTVCHMKYLLSFDLIPLQFPDLYLHDPAVRDNYLCRYQVQNEADHFFPISRTVATDLTLHLGIPRENMTPVYGAPIKRKRLTPTPIEFLEHKKYVLLPSGDDYRKNNRRAVQAFNAFNKLHDYEYTLVVTSFFGEHTKIALRAYSNQLYFSGNVSETELTWLYRNAHIILFPSEYEGLGLPVLEAVEFMKPVVCSDIQVFRELSETAFIFCDPYDIDSIAKALQQADVHKIDENAYAEILTQYSWPKTAKLMANSLRNVEPRIAARPKLKLAIFAPVASGFSAIGKVVQEQHYVLSRYADVDYYLEHGVTERAKATSLRMNYLKYVSNVYNPLTFDSKSSQQYDKVIYHIGNGEHHVATLTKALSYPDTVILHDTDIEGLYNVTLSVGLISASRREAERNLEKLIAPKNGHFLSSLVSKQHAVVVHSEYARRAVESAAVPGLAVKIDVQNLPSQSLYYVSMNHSMHKITVGLAGIIHQDKGLEFVSDIAQLTLPNKSLRIKIFGFSLVIPEVERALHALPNVEVIQSPSDTTFANELIACDVVVNYRSNYHGETSLSTLEALRLGKEVITNDAGWFAELPEGIVRKVSNPAAISHAIKEIAAEDRDTRVKSSMFKVSYVSREHTIETYVRNLLEITT